MHINVCVLTSCDVFTTFNLWRTRPPNDDDCCCCLNDDDDLNFDDEVKFLYFALKKQKWILCHSLLCGSPTKVSIYLPFFFIKRILLSVLTHTHEHKRTFIRAYTHHISIHSNQNIWKLWFLFASVIPRSCFIFQKAKRLLYL